MLETNRRKSEPTHVGCYNERRHARPRHSEIALGSKLGIDATKKLPGEGFNCPWPPLIKMDESVRKKVDALFGGNT